MGRPHGRSTAPGRKPSGSEAPVESGEQPRAKRAVATRLAWGALPLQRWHFQQAAQRPPAMAARERSLAAWLTSSNASASRHAGHSAWCYESREMSELATVSLGATLPSTEGWPSSPVAALECAEPLRVKKPMVSGPIPWALLLRRRSFVAPRPPHPRWTPILHLYTVPF